MQPVKEFDYVDFSMVREVLKLANEIVEAASVVVCYGMVSLMIEQKALRSVPDLRELQLANGIDESVSVGRLRQGIPMVEQRHRGVCLDDTELLLRGSS